MESIPWATLELKIPREIRKSPRAMEQVFHSLNALRNEAGNFREKWIDGEVPRWFSLEIVSFGGEVHFYVHLYAKQRDLVEAAFLSYYPDIEIEEIDDYTNRFPVNVRELHNQSYELFGGEIMLRRESAYPIRTYTAFEAIDETKEYDPISALLEVLAKVKKGETVAIQFLITPLDSKWGDKWKGLVEELKSGKKKSAAKPKTNVTFPGPANIGPLPHLETIPAKNEASPERPRTPGETDVLKAVENNLSKPAFLTQIRFLYISPRSIFNNSFPQRGLLGAFSQYSSLNLNSLAINYKVTPMIKFYHRPYLFPNLRNEYHRERLLQAYKDREIAGETFLDKLLTSHPFSWNFSSRTFEMNVESLATLFHPPTYIVLTAPHMVLAPSHKMGPPAGTAIFGGEEEIERFK